MIPREITRRLRISPNTVQTIQKIFAPNESVLGAKQTGRPQKLEKRGERNIGRILICNPKLTQTI